MIVSASSAGRSLRFALTIVSALTFLVHLCRPCRADDETEFFEKRIRPILVNRCESCHSASKGKTHGGLALDSKQGWEKGGETGPAIIPGKVDESLLIQAIRYRDSALQMPPEDGGGKLTEAETTLLIEWVSRGAHDPRKPIIKRGGLSEEEIRNWWSFQPLTRDVSAEDVLKGRSDPINQIDRFLQAKLDAEGLTVYSEADRRTLIRRATYDLTGLPPTAEDVDAFLADTSSTAYEALINRLLESPHYGERWGRHWLDLVRYADTAGENSDHPVPDAWRYRNWVIGAFQRDIPYDQFIREQIAGDQLHVSDPAIKYAEGVISTGYLAIARRFEHDSDKNMHLTFEDTIDTLGKTFLGLSIACARCHDHKYDPISSSDYYALYGILSSTRFAFPGCEAKQQPRDLVPLIPPTEWAKTVEPYDQKLAAIDDELKQLTGLQTALGLDLKAATPVASQLLARGEIPDGGTQKFNESIEHALNSVAVKVGQIIKLLVDPSGNYGADSTSIDWEINEIGGERRRWNLTQDVISDFLVSNPHGDRFGNKAVWMFLDGRGGNSLLSEMATDVSGKPGLFAWRNGETPSVFVNATDQPIGVWTNLPPRTLFVHPASDGPVGVAWVSPIEGKVQIGGRIADAHPGGPNGVQWKIEHQLADHSEVIERMAAANVQRTDAMLRRTELVGHAPVREFGYAVVEGVAADARMHLRGDPEKLGDEVPRRWLELFGGQRLPSDAGSGRLQLAQWLSDPSNPLISRVMANRIWQYHFGKGLVQTPNDFGTRGQRPTHPELLDWLSIRFIESGWSIKTMHRLIMNSAAYRRSSIDGSRENHAKAMNIDPNNNLYWRFNRQRLNAEELRDTLLMASQEIDLATGGPHPIPPASSWSYSQHVPFAGVPETNKRSVYMMTVRNRRNPFMGLFDGADPNATTPQRQVTTVPTQSLYFLNDSFFHRQAEKVAARIVSLPEDRAKLDLLFRIVLQRTPSESERDSAAMFLTRYLAAIDDVPIADRPIAAWSAYARILLASNEFLYLD